MRALVALVRKELRQHALVGLALGVFLALSYAMVLFGALANDTVTVLEAHGIFGRMLLPVLAVFLGHRLVVTEYFGRTFLFLEALPMPRATFLGVKAALFALVLLTSALGSQLLVFGVASLRESVDAAYFGVVLARTLTWAFFLFAFFFTTALLGRFRYPFYALVGLAAWALDTLAKLDLSDHGPLALVNHTFVLERSVLPVEPLVSTLLASAILLLLAGVLALGRGGMLAGAMAGRLSARERSVVGALVIAGLISMSAVDQEPERFDPVAGGAGWLTSESPRLRVYYGDASREAAARQVFAVVGEDLRSLAPIVGPAEMPAVFVVLREGLGPEEVEPEGEGEVPVVRVSPAATAGPALRAAVVEQVVLARSEGRADFEPHAWLLPAFSRWFAARDAAELDPAILRRALWATRGPRSVRISRPLLRRWHRTRERLGEPIAAALATTGLGALAARHGKSTVLALGHAFFDRPARSTSLTVIDELLDPPDDLFREATGVSVPAFLAEWRSWLAERRRGAPAVGTPASAALESIPLGGAIRALRARVTGAPGALRIRHARLGPFDEALEEPSDLATAAGDVVGVYGPGDRVFAAVEVDDPELGCPVRLFARRFEVR